jgi:hypothetical protein
MSPQDIHMIAIEDLERAFGFRITWITPRILDMEECKVAHSPMADLSFLGVHLDALGRLAVAVLVLIAPALFVQYRFSATGYVQMLLMTPF